MFPKWYFSIELLLGCRYLQIIILTVLNRGAISFGEEILAADGSVALIWKSFWASFIILFPAGESSWWDTRSLTRTCFRHSSILKNSLLLIVWCPSWCLFMQLSSSIESIWCTSRGKRSWFKTVMDSYCMDIIWRRINLCFDIRSYSTINCLDFNNISDMLVNWWTIIVRVNPSIFENNQIFVWSDVVVFTFSAQISVTLIHI